MGGSGREEGLKEDQVKMKGKEGSPTFGTGKARPPKQTVAEEERKSEPPKQSLAQREEESRLPLLVRKLDTLKRDMQFQMVFTMADECRRRVLY